jgi:hypothetical protein
MDEVWARAALVGGALAVAGVVVLVQRLRARPSPRTVAQTGLDPGVYLFTSASCSTCAQARQTLQTELGEDRFYEFAWEEGSETFDRLGIDAVPAVLVVESGGGGTIFPGQPDRALRRIDAGFDP